MKPEKLVTSLKVSRKLKEIGVVQLSWFSWIVENNIYPYKNHIELNSHIGYTRGEDRNCKEYISAFTLQEVLVMVPDGFEFFHGSKDVFDLDINELGNDLAELSVNENFKKAVNANLKKFWEE